MAFDWDVNGIENDGASCIATLVALLVAQGGTIHSYGTGTGGTVVNNGTGFTGDSIRDSSNSYVVVEIPTAAGGTQSILFQRSTLAMQSAGHNTHWWIAFLDGIFNHDGTADVIPSVATGTRQNIAGMGPNSTEQVFDDDNAGGLYRWQCGADAAGNHNWWAAGILPGVGTVRLFMFYDGTTEIFVTRPSIVGKQFGDAGIPANPGTTYRMTGPYTGAGTWDGPSGSWNAALGTSYKSEWFSQAVGLSSVNPDNNKDDLLPFFWFTYDTITPRYKGTSAMFKLALKSRPTGTVISTGEDFDRAVISNIAVPWPKSTAFQI